MGDAPPPAAAAKPAAGGADKEAKARPLGPDGKPIPGPAEVRQIQAARKMAQQQAQVKGVIIARSAITCVIMGHPVSICMCQNH